MVQNMGIIYFGQIYVGTTNLVVLLLFSTNLVVLE
jgi:hypothetical protein